MKPLKLKKNDYGLRVFCPKCNRKWNYNKLYKCKHFKHQKYKQYVYPKGGAKVRTYETRDFDSVLIQAINFKKEAFNQNKVSTMDCKLDNSLTVIDAVNYYLDYKEGINVPHHLKKEISKKHLEDIELNLKYFVQVLRDNDIEPTKLYYSDINEYHVGYWAQFLDNSFKKSSWNKRISILKSFSKYIIKKFRIEMYDHFEDVGRVEVDGITETINEKEFYKVLDAINSKNKYQSLNGKQKRVYRYRDYLEEAFKMALYTGLRREEYLTLSWNDIQYSQLSMCYLIVTNNKKVERITKKKFKPKVIPVHLKLEELLIQLGWDSLTETDRSKYIIKPSRTASIDTMKRCCTNAFRHYYQQAFPGVKHKPLGCLRNTYLSLQNREVGDEMTELSSYGSMKTLKKHYIDKKLVTKAMNIQMF